VNFTPNGYVLRFNSPELIDFIKPADDANLCAISGQIITYEGMPASNVQVEISIFGWVSGNVVQIGRPAFYPPAMISAVPGVIYTDSYGMISFKALRKTLIKVEAYKAGYLKILEVPDQGSASLMDLKEYEFRYR